MLKVMLNVTTILLIIVLLSLPHLELVVNCVVRGIEGDEACRLETGIHRGTALPELLV